MRLQGPVLRLALLLLLGAAALALLPPSASAATPVGPAFYNTDQTWTQAGSPYYVRGAILVFAELTIEPGVDVFFDGPHTILVFGGLHVLGNSSAPVHFASNNTTVVPQWGGLTFQGTVNSSEVLNATIDRATVAFEFQQPSADITVSDVAVTRADTYGLRAAYSRANISVYNFSVEDSANGALINNSSFVRMSAYRTSNLTAPDQYSLELVTVDSSDFLTLDFPESRVRVVSCQWLNFSNVSANASAFSHGFYLEGSDTVNLTSARLDGYVNYAFYSELSFAVAVSSLTVSE